MPEGRNRPGGFHLQLLALLLGFLLVLALLVQVYGRAALLSQETARLNGAVGLARDAAEAFSASSSPAETVSLLGLSSSLGQQKAFSYFDQAGQPSAEQTAYTLELSWQEEQTEAGGLLSCRIRVLWAGEEKELYALTTQKYLSGRQTP